MVPAWPRFLLKPRQERRHQPTRRWAQPLYCGVRPVVSGLVDSQSLYRVGTKDRDQWLDHLMPGVASADIRGIKT